MYHYYDTTRIVVQNVFLCFALVVHTYQSPLMVELQVDIVRELDVVAVALLVNLGDDGAREFAGDVLLDSLRNDACRNSSHVTVDFLPVAFAVELNLSTVVQAALIAVPVFLSIENLLALEVGLHEGLGSYRQLFNGDRSVVG